jgi:hypothetical protein
LNVQSSHHLSDTDEDRTVSPCLPPHVRRPPADAAERLRVLLAEAANEDPRADAADFAAFRKAINESRSDGRKLY